MKKIVAALGILVMTAGLLFAFSTPASAHVSGKECVSYNSITTCVEAQWVKQSDGDGVRLEGFWIDTTNGCGEMYSPDRYHGVQAMWDHPGDAGWDGQRSWNFGDEDCNFYKDLEARGRDNGGMDFKVYLVANRILASNKSVHIGLRLLPNGGHDVLYKIVT